MPQGLRDQTCIKKREVAAPVGFRDQNSGDTELRQPRPQASVVGAVLLSKFADPGDGNLVGQVGPNGLIKELLIIGESEIHIESFRLSLCRFGFARHTEASLGNDVFLDLGGPASNDQTQREH